MIQKAPHLSKAGQVYQNFRLTRLTEIPELQCLLYELVHEPTNAQVMHIANDDPENLFCMSFQTLPHKSNGVAHILEHTVLCGSKKYPVKDPFFAMTRRSLNTFMNALTGSDFTCYPAASQVPKDFYNLLEVYLDAVFHPNLSYLSFIQEGHRLEFADPTNPHSPLEYKGIVFNEMKGALSSPSARMSEAMHAALFPDITYGINSGGSPREIPSLTYEELLNFYNTFYHPSRCLFFFYGNMSLEKHLKFIEEHALKDVKKADPLPPIPLQPRFTEPRYLSDSYPVSDDDEHANKAIISFGWLTCHVQEQEELLALSILEIILMDTDASPLKKALLKSGLCKLVSSHIDTDISENPFLITLRGCNTDEAEQCQKLITNTLLAIINNGIPLSLVESAIHQLEFYRSEIGGDHAPFGLSLFMRSALLKQHKVDPVEGIKIHSLFDGVHKKVLEDPNYLGNLIKKYLLDNPHFVRIVMTPDKELASRELLEERQILETIQSQMTPENAKTLIKQSEELANFQKKQEEEDIDILPKVCLNDIPKNSRNFELLQEKIGNIEVFHHATFTNKIVYADLVFDVPDLKQEELFLARLLTYLMPQMGVQKRNYVENLEYIQANTGGLSVSLTFNMQAQNYNALRPALSIRTKALHRKAPKMFSLLEDVATSVKFDDIPRLTEVIQKHYTALDSSLTQGALKYAINLSASGLDVPAMIANEWYGLEYFRNIRQVSQYSAEEMKKLAVKLENFSEKLLCLENPHLILTCEASMYEEIKAHNFYGLSHLTTKPYTPWKGDFTLKQPASQARIIASPVAFTGKVFKTVSYVHPDAPALSVAACLFDNLTLHTKLREQGGAYGGGTVSNSMSGNFYFYAYRDPNIVSTLSAFKLAVDDLLQGNFDENDLEEAKLEIIQGLDDPVAPGSRGDHAYGWLREGKTLTIRQAFRDRLLSLNVKDVIKAVETWVGPQLDKSATVVFAGRDLIEKENARLRGQGLPVLPIETI